VDATAYFTRLVQRLVTALSAPTEEGSLYEVDMQLRPSGRAGPVVVRFDAFQSYYAEKAWTWELMALTRARVVSAGDRFRREIETEISQTLTRPRDVSEAAADVADMRARIEQAKPASAPWSVKYVRGGLVDIEFICQFLQLAHASRAQDILSANTRSAFRKIWRAGLIKPADAERLIHAAELMLNLQQITRLCVEGEFDVEAATPGLRDLLLRSYPADDFDALTALLVCRQGEVRALFDQLIAKQAARR
ncbi:MAG: bifunctional [glutamine synthetase] adenylyltransferase/[glutamine synthetase]-adenylyl-L-tyrosine phosphorylase, partial [Pseudomonadota bacterium]